MKLTSELALKQTMSMTTDMRMAIDMLTMSSLEIDDLIEEELQKNPFLEEGEDYGRITHGGASSWQGEQAAPIDVALQKTATSYDFREQLVRQVGEQRWNSLEVMIAHVIINSLDDDGFFADVLEIEHDLMEGLGIFPEWIESVRLRIMDLEPIGCAAKDINESLVHQVKRKCRVSQNQFLSILAEFKDKPSGKITAAIIERLRSAGDLFELRMLNPRPSSQANNDNFFQTIIAPDVIVHHVHDTLSISLLKRSSTRLQIRRGSSFSQTKGGEGRVLKDEQRRASFLMRALEFRENSLLAVSRAIVEHQSGWFLHNEPQRPLCLRDVAEICGLHESSISRLVRGKYLVCSRGSFELKQFFSGAVQDDNGSSKSATSIKEQIKTYIRNENKMTPLSDQKIQEMLKDNGMGISRRTVAKYREGMNIAPANERRALLG